MKRYLKTFIPDFRPKSKPDASFDLRDFENKDFICPIEKGTEGVYVITGSANYIYPGGKTSPIIYIGESTDLLRRLRDEHYTKNLKLLLEDPDYGISRNIQIASRYQYMYYDGSHVDVFRCRGNQDSKNLESFILNQFYQYYRAIPVGNGARSFGQDE